jgi:hypothetical protein
MDVGGEKFRTTGAGATGCSVAPYAPFIRPDDRAAGRQRQGPFLCVTHSHVRAFIGTPSSVPVLVRFRFLRARKPAKMDSCSLKRAIPSHQPFVLARIVIISSCSTAPAVNVSSVSGHSYFTLQFFPSTWPLLIPLDHSR